MARTEGMPGHSTQPEADATLAVGMAWDKAAQCGDPRHSAQDWSTLRPNSALRPQDAIGLCAGRHIHASPPSKNRTRTGLVLQWLENVNLYEARAQDQHLLFYPLAVQFRVTAGGHATVHPLNTRLKLPMRSHLLLWHFSMFT